MNEALAALDTIKEADINYIKKLGNPPAAIKLVLEAICVILDAKPAKVKDESGKMVNDYWKPSVALMNEKARGAPGLLKGQAVSRVVLQHHRSLCSLPPLGLPAEAQDLRQGQHPSEDHRCDQDDLPHQRKLYPRCRQESLSSCRGEGAVALGWLRLILIQTELS